MPYPSNYGSNYGSNYSSNYSASYKNKPPRSINLVSIFLVLLLIAGVYAGWKFIPPVWQATKVDAILEDLKNEAADARGLNPKDREAGEDKVIAQAVQRIHELGVADVPGYPVRAWLTANDAELDAEYHVIIVHPFVHKQTTLAFHRRVKVPGDPPGL